MMNAKTEGKRQRDNAAESASKPAKRSKLEASAQEKAAGDESTRTTKTGERKTVAKRVGISDQLRIVISNLYLNVSGRLKLRFPPSCASDVGYCHRQHYRTPLPEAPSDTHAEHLRFALQNEQFLTLVNCVIDMLHRGEFPGDGIFTKLLELILSNDSRKAERSGNKQLHSKFSELFSLAINTFPPCWCAMRPFYVTFFQRSLSAACTGMKGPRKSTTLFEVILDMFEVTLDACTPEQLREEDVVQHLPENSAASPKCPEFLDPWEWELQPKTLQSFQSLEPNERLERLFIVLDLILQILEHDFVMWTLHHQKKAREMLFWVGQRPLIVIVFELTRYEVSTPIVQRLFQLFAESVRHGLHSSRLEVLGRYIALLMVIRNMANMEATSIGLKYPYIVNETIQLIHEFFKIFKEKNTSKVSKYISTIEVLRTPFLRYEFIDRFLQFFYFARTTEALPKKVVYDIYKKRWLKYQPAAEVDASVDDNLSREQYLRLLLIAVDAYCDWHGTREFYQMCAYKKPAVALTTATNSVHQTPVRENSQLLLEKMAADMPKLKKQLKLTVRMAKPRVELPIADICIDEELAIKYRNDMQHLMALHNIVAKQSIVHADIDFRALQELLKDFASPLDKPIALVL